MPTNVTVGADAAGGSTAMIVKWTIMVTDLAALASGLGAFQPLWTPPDQIAPR